MVVNFLSDIFKFKFYKKVYYSRNELIKLEINSYNSNKF